MNKLTHKTTTNPDAAFLGWQETLAGSHFALFNITAAGHPASGSTVSAETLRKYHLQVPQIPVRRDRIKKRRL
jgi:hypothetical protein